MRNEEGRRGSLLFFQDIRCGPGFMFHNNVTVHTLFRHLLPEQGQKMRLARHPALAAGELPMGWMPLQFAAGLLFGQV